jgi:thioredoxin reductase
LEQFDIVIIGSGPAGLAAALEIEQSGLKQIIIERENRAGGILKQCIHDGFGLHRFKKRLTGPEYAELFLKRVIEKKIPIYKNTFVTEIIGMENKSYRLTLVNSEKCLFEIEAKALILANGCRERTAKQVFIQGTRPAGVYTAGTAQYFTNILGYLPCKKCVILGSGDIGLIMARRLTLEGAKVVGVYEVKDTPSGLSRNIAQCLDDFDIPLYLSKTVTKIHGDKRVEAVTVQKVDLNLNQIPGTEEIIACDGLILSVGLVPENELAKSLGVELDTHTKGPMVNQSLMTSKEGIFSCGNALHVHDLVDFVSESAEIAAKGGIRFVQNKGEEELIHVEFDEKSFLYIVPQKINLLDIEENIHFYFRSKKVLKNVSVVIRTGDTIIFKKFYHNMKPPEMETISVNLKNVLQNKEICFELKEGVST